MITQPHAIDFNTIDFVLRELGCDVRKGKGSHFVYKHKDFPQPITIPFAKPIKRYYVNRVITLFELKELYDEID